MEKESFESGVERRLSDA